MLLSIIIMMKNEEKYLNKTLSALNILRNRIQCELIILDTGSTDSSVSIAKKYTEKVYFKEWNNSFSEMRNISIGYAKGEWILIIDADEELINCDKLVEFFKTGLYKKYNMATIELKNINSEDEKNYSMASIPRLFKNDKDFKYTGDIHEQPVCKAPIYNRISTFKHYGYLYQDEEINQYKSNRNKTMLKKELRKNTENPYINYQLAKEYIISKNYEVATIHMEKSFKIYNKNKYVPIYVISDLASLYIIIREYKKCEDLCNYYIKNDDKNIDIYFHLATAQIELRNYKDSIENYLNYQKNLSNYELSTQANNMESTCDTLILKDTSNINIIVNYYKLNKYSDIVKMIERSNDEVIEKSIYFIASSLYKENKFEDIIKIYYRNFKTMLSKNSFKNSLELLIMNIEDEDRDVVYRVLSKIEGSYGYLNRIRLGEKLAIEEYKDILANEVDSYYGDILYYSLKDNIDIEELMCNISCEKVQAYTNYIVINRRDCILKLYEMLLSKPIKLEIKNIVFCSSLVKSLLFAGNLVGEKYKNIFLMYITYQYEYIKQLYRSNFNDDELISLVKDTESIFILQFISIQELKENNPVEYVKKMKRLLVENTQYKKGIELFIHKFQEEINENEELKNLKKKYKEIIEENINNSNLDTAEKLIQDYEDMFKYEDLNSIKAIISIYKNNIEEAEKYLKLAYCNNRNDEDLLFNIAYVKENKGEIKNAIDFYNKILSLTQKSNLRCEVLENIKKLQKDTIYI